MGYSFIEQVFNSECPSWTTQSPDITSYWRPARTATSRGPRRSTSAWRPRKLSAGGRLICPFLRPNFISRRQYDSLVKTGESLIGAIDRMEQMVLANPALLARLELLPAEKMLAAIDPGYQALEVAARLDSHLYNGHLHFVQYNADSPTGAGYADALADCSTNRRRSRNSARSIRWPRSAAASTCCRRC